jgi:hypothetical protein
VIDCRIIEAFHVYLVELPYLVLTELSVSEVLFYGIRADDAWTDAGVGIFDDLRALVANFAELGDLVQKVGVLVAVQVHLVCQRFLEIVSA